MYSDIFGKVNKPVFMYHFFVLKIFIFSNYCTLCLKDKFREIAVNLNNCCCLYGSCYL